MNKCHRCGASLIGNPKDQQRRELPDASRVIGMHVVCAKCAVAIDKSNHRMTIGVACVAVGFLLTLIAFGLTTDWAGLWAKVSPIAGASSKTPGKARLRP